MLFLIMKKVILGATGSIGSSLAKNLVDSGDQVHLVGRDENSLSELAKKLNKKSREILDAAKYLNIQIKSHLSK